MRKLKTILGFTGLLFLSLVLGSSQNPKEELSESFKVEGKINMASGTMIVVNKLAPNSIMAIDSVYTDEDGNFNFQGSEEQSMIYYLTFKTANPPGVPMVVENGAQIKIDIKVGNGYDVAISGGKYNESMQKLHKLYTKYDREVKAFDKEVNSVDPNSVTKELQTEINSTYRRMIMERTQAIENFVKEEEPTPATFFAVRYLFSKPESRLIFLAADRMEQSIPESEYTQQLVDYKIKLGNLAEGALAPNIKLESPNGDTIELHSLRGKVVLIDFWASWCGPCRKENPNVVKLYEKYKDRGFEIFAVSLDQDHAKWEKAILQDNLTWLHVSDLKGWRSSASKLYNVGSIPQTYLIDQEGKIYKVGLRSHDLEPILEHLLN